MGFKFAKTSWRIPKKIADISASIRFEYFLAIKENGTDNRRENKLNKKKSILPL